MSKKYTHKQGFKPKDEIQISIIKKDIPGLHGDLIPKVQLVMDAWLKYSTLKQYLVDKYSDVPPFNGEPFTEATPKRSELYEKVLTILKKIPIADNPNGCDRYGIDSACAELEDVFIKESLKNRPTSSEQNPILSMGEILDRVANDHSYDSWGDLCNDCNVPSLVSYAKEAMQEYAQSERLKARNEAIDECITLLEEINREEIDVDTYLLSQLEKLKSKTI